MRAYSFILAIAIGLAWAWGVEACDYCLVSQGVSPLETQRGTGVRLEQR